MENKEPSGNDKAEQEARSEEDKQKTEQLLEGQRKSEPITAKLVLGILNVYLLFVTALVAFGVLAYYGGHLTILKAVFVASGLLLLVLPIVAFWYLWVRYRRPATKKPDSKGLLIRLLQSRIGRFFTRIIDNPIYELLQLSSSVFMIVWAIKRFHREPRLSLTVIVIYLTMFFVISALHFMRRLVGQVEEGVRTQMQMLEIIQHHNSAIDRIHKYLDDDARSDSEIHKSILTAIEATNRAVQEVHTTTGLLMAENMLKAEVQPKQLDAPPVADDEED
jgi:ABC-type multidrug transport system fused ATPase/permease subunit